MYDTSMMNDLDEKRWDLFDDNPLENLSVGKKPNSLPPLTNELSSRNVKARSDNGTSLYTGIKASMTTRVSSKSLLRKNIETDIHIEHLFKRNKEVSKTKLNEFDALCANLVQKRENEIISKKNRSQLKQTNSNPIIEKVNEIEELTRSSNSVRRSNTFKVSDDNDGSDLDIKEDIVRERKTSKKIKGPKTPRDEHLTKEKSKPERPKTGYGRRRKISIEEY